MAFKLNSWNNVSSGAVTGAKVWSYITTDTLALTALDGYFNKVKQAIKKDDLIYIAASDGVEQRKVTSVAHASPVTTELFVDGDYLTPDDIGVTVQAELSGETITAVTVAGNDKVLIQDTDDSDNLKTVTAQAIADLGGAGGGASVALDNLSGVAINTSLVSDTNNTDDLGSPTVKWLNLYANNLKTGTSPGDSMYLAAYDTVGMSYGAFITLTAGNPYTCSLSTLVTGVTQSPLSNNTRLATTEYVDTAVAAADSSSAVTSTFTAGEAITAGDLLYLHTDGDVWKAFSNGTVAQATPIGVANTSGLAAASIIVTTFGYCPAALLITPGNKYYVSSTPGVASATAPASVGQHIVEIGTGLDSNYFNFNPKFVYTKG